MKTSNLIITLFFLCCILFICAFTFTVNTRYSNRDYELGDDAAGNFVTHSLPKCSVVAIKNVSSVVIIPADSFAIAVEKSSDNIKYRSLHDTLTILGSASNTPGNPVKLYLPSVNSIHASGSSIEIKGALKRNDPWLSYQFYLDNSKLSTTELPSDLRVLQHYRDFIITGGGGAELHLHGGTFLHHLKIVDVTLVVIENNVKLEKLETEYSDKARIVSVSSGGRTEIRAQ